MLAVIIMLLLNYTKPVPLRTSIRAVLALAFRTLIFGVIPAFVCLRQHIVYGTRILTIVYDHAKLADKLAHMGVCTYIYMCVCIYTC